MPWRAHAAKTPASGLRHSIEYCGWLEQKAVRPFAAADCCRRVDLLGCPLAESDGAHLS